VLQKWAFVREPSLGPGSRPTCGVGRVKPLVLVTGGAGFIGSYIVGLLLESGFPVRIYDSLVEQVHDNPGARRLPDEAEFVRGDVRDADSLSRALAGVEIVVHDAAE